MSRPAATAMLAHMTFLAGILIASFAAIAKDALRIPAGVAEAIGGAGMITGVVGIFLLAAE